MKVSMDGLRRNLAAAYRMTLKGYKAGLKEMTEEGLRDLRMVIAGFMCVFSENPDDLMTDMSDEAEKLCPLAPGDEDDE